MQAPPRITQGASADELVRANGDLVEALLTSEVWGEIVFPLLSEGVASVSGRYTNGRFHHGDLTRSETNRDFLAGYQKGLMDLSNRLSDFVEAKKKLALKKKAEAASESAPMINPFLEDAE